MTITAEHIPDEVVEAAARDIFIVGFDRAPAPQDPTDEDRLDFARKYARAAIAAALAAWPGGVQNPHGDYFITHRDALILPLPAHEDTHD